MKTKKCPYCGEIIPDDSKICPICGESLPIEKNKTRKWLAYTAGAVAALLVLLLFVFLLKGNGNGPTTELFTDNNSSTRTDWAEEPDIRSKMPSEEDVEDFDYSEYASEVIPEGLWTHSTFSGTMAANGETYNIELALSYPGAGEIYCEVVGSYHYKGRSDLIPLEGEWIDFDMGRVVMLCLYSDQYLERFEFELDQDDLLSTSILKGDWTQYATEDDYSMTSNPKAKLKVLLKSIQ